MTPTAHTPGIWHVENHVQFYTVCDEQGVTIADIPIQPLDPQEWAEGNAHLIAAAPKMLEALHLCEDVLSDLARLDDGTPSISALNMTRTAIAEAKGAAS